MWLSASSSTIAVIATSSFATGKRSGCVTPNSHRFDGRVVVEIGAIGSSGDPCAILVLKSVFEVVLGSTQVSARG